MLRKSEELCLQELSVEHVHRCQTAARRMRPQRSVLLALTDERRLMCGYVDVERYCADLLKAEPDGEVQEAWMEMCTPIPG